MATMLKSLSFFVILLIVNSLFFMETTEARPFNTMKSRNSAASRAIESFFDGLSLGEIKQSGPTPGKSEILAVEDETLAVFPETFEEHKEELQSDIKAELAKGKIILDLGSAVPTQLFCRILESQQGQAGQRLEISLKLHFILHTTAHNGIAVPDCIISLSSPTFGLLGAAVLFVSTPFPHFNYVQIEIDVPCSGEILINYISHQSV
ncbi:hypothetical protein POTOM_052258 [Populus tomentosa]|uniref:Uncharacterized protein n=1 Tax=Populus tomentosa TaxID=118781 RepID=A0A8X8C8J1_POPTO|nr:hypothetical protein POTOM_052258 [Populus tomentosa]